MSKAWVKASPTAKARAAVQDDLVDSRLGVVYLFSALDLETKRGPVIFEAMLGVASAGLSLTSALLRNS